MAAFGTKLYTANAQQRPEIQQISQGLHCRIRFPG